MNAEPKTPAGFMNFDKIYLARYATFIAVASALFGSLMMFILGAFRAALAFQCLLDVNAACGELLPSDLPQSSVVMLMLIQAIDMFLFALVLLIFSFGVYQLFISEHIIHDRPDVPKWRQIESVTQLKKIIAEVVIVILIVLFLEKIIVSATFATDFQSLTIPIAILLFSLGLWLMRRD